jgi:hypothetical protein
MTEPLHATVEGSVLPAVQEVYDSALLQHPEYADMPAEYLQGIIGRALARIAVFEDAARPPLYISPETADAIGTIWVHSGTGNYDMPFKAGDNPRLLDNPWMGGWDRSRLGRAALLARKIAEVRSGTVLKPGPITELPARLQATKELIAAYGPTIVYSGYPTETAYAEKLVERDGIIMPKSKVMIIHGDLKTTADAVRTFEYPDDSEAQSKEVAVVSHAPHLGARILHMMNYYHPLVQGSVPYMVPIATPAEGRREFALMETRGLLYYMLLAQQAAEEPHPYRLLH